MLSLYVRLRRFLDFRPTGLLARRRGQGLVEYALILVLVAIVVIVALTAMGQQIRNVFSNITTTLTGGG